MRCTSTAAPPGWRIRTFSASRGLFRSVYLYAKPKVHIRDIWLKAELAEGNTTGLLTPIVKLDGETDGARVHLRLTDGEEFAPL